jgi:GH15 family glucan-1,4-alpha-glucosidase
VDPNTRLEQLGLIGNCRFAALVADDGEIVWACLPRFDSEPVFASLLDAGRGGRFVVGTAGGDRGVARYLPNTNVLETTFETPSGRFAVTDFVPRFEQYERYFYPSMIVRMLRPLEGSPRVRVLCEPTLGWSRREPRVEHGSNHVDFDGFDARVRLTTDIPLSYLSGRPFALTGPHHLAFTWGTPIEEPLAGLCERFLACTVRYWERWVKRCNVPLLYQDEVIRSALALKLHCFDDTGAVVAAVTTSLPESPGSGRTWDYRYCWLRDSYYTLDALRILGHFEERERFVHYLLNVAGDNPTLDLAPLYSIDGRADTLTERVLPDWPGYAGEGPVRVGNQAAQHKQHDIFGEMVLALAPVFLDERFRADRDENALRLLERLAGKAIEVAGTPDAGIWEYRADWQPQTFSSLMCWAAADRMATVADRHLPGRAARYREAAARIRAEIAEKSWNEARRCFVSTYGGQHLDAALLQMASLHFLERDDPRLHATIDRIGTELATDGLLYRYRTDDGFGTPQVAFTLCTFWQVEALAAIGRMDEARRVLERALAVLSPLGLLSEDYDVSGPRMWGNFPQAYSHVGLVRAAFAASPRWADVL